MKLQIVKCPIKKVPFWKRGETPPTYVPVNDLDNIPKTVDTPVSTSETHRDSTPTITTSNVPRSPWLRHLQKSPSFPTTPEITVTEDCRRVS